jgi:cyanophycin synthetase
MKILNLQTLKGPNYWSIRRHQLIVMHLDLEEMDEVFSNEVPGFYQGLIIAMPSLGEHGCSKGYPGGFFERVQEGTLMGHIIEHIALELQSLAGMEVAFGRTRMSSKQGIYRVVFEYKDPAAGRYAARAAVRICKSLIETGHYPQSKLQKDIEALKEIWAEALMGPTTESLIDEAIARNIPWRESPARSVLQFGYGIHQRRMQAAQTDATGILGIELAGDKEGTKTALREAGIPVPKGDVIYFEDELDEAIQDVGGFPIVLKPLDGNHGRGITLNITSHREAERAFDFARDESKSGSVIVERFYQGKDYRVLVVGGQVVAVAERVPAHVVGDGRLTIEELVEKTNRDPRRGNGHDNVLTRIKIDKQAEDVLAGQGYTLSSIPDEGEVCYLRATANLSTGGIAIDRTDDIHPETRWICERAARIIGLDIAGLDITSPDITRPLREVDGVIVEVNAAPGLRMHLQPSVGQPRNVAAAIFDLLYPDGAPSRIPITAITGTNGKTTTTRLIAHIMRQTHKVVGYTTTDGTYIGDYLIDAGDNTGSQSAGMILHDPTVEVAVLETARGGILRSGLGFDRADVGVVLNISADHLGLQDINTVEDMAHVKSVVAESVQPNGYVVLNADDPLVAKMAERAKAKAVYFSMNPMNPLIQAELLLGNLVAIYEEGYITLRQGDRIIRVEQVLNIPMTLRGLAPFQIANALAATLAAYVQDVSVEDISTALRTFEVSTTQTPGRMNLINCGHFHVLIDYAHNPASYRALGEFVRNWSTGPRVGVIGAPGDRRDVDFLELGQLSAQIFDSIVIKEDDDTRGRRRGDVANWIGRGIQAENSTLDYQTILDEETAIQLALANAKPGSLVVILPDRISRAIDLVNQPSISA